DVVFVGRGEVAFDPGVVEEPVDPSEGRHGRLGIAAHRALLGAVREVGDRIVPGVDELRSPLLQPLAVDVDQHDPGAFAREDLRGGEADRPGTAGHDHRLALVAHPYPPFRNGSVSRNHTSRGVSSFRNARASSGVSVAAIGIVPNTLPLSTRLSPWRSTLVTCISSDLSAA